MLNEHAQYKMDKGRPENGARKVFSSSIERLSMSHLYTPNLRVPFEGVGVKCVLKRRGAFFCYIHIFC